MVGGGGWGGVACRGVRLLWEVKFWGGGLGRYEEGVSW